MKDRAAGAASVFDLSAISARVAGALESMQGWFGPGQPMQPMAPVAEAGRAFDYPVGVNMTNTPRANEPISFAQLRALADHHELTRLAIETRKDQLCKFGFAVVFKEDGKKPDDTCREIETFLQSPDREHDWDQWLRMLVEEMLVIDAASIYSRMTNGGKLYALELIDGATIKRVVDSTGRTPIPPLPAYQQILKGVPATNYTVEELLYRPRNPRAHKFYGFSPVEQIVMIINIGIRRSLGMLDYFTAGTIPDALCGVPEGWTVDQIKAFQTYWDALLTGDPTNKRRMRFVPGDMAKGYKETKQPPEKSVFDEWIARVVMYAFSLEATPFVAQVNRAVAETNRDQALTEGLAPLQKWVAGIIETMIRRHWKRDDLRFKWITDESVDPKTQADIDVAYVNAGILLKDEVRQRMGRDPLPEEPPPIAGEIDPETGLPIEPEVGPDGKPIPPKPGVATKPTPALPAPSDDETKATKEKAAPPFILNVTLPPIELRQPDLFVEVGPTTVHANIDASPGGKATQKTVVAKRDPITGSMSGTITETIAGRESFAVTKTITAERKDDGTMSAVITETPTAEE